MTNDSEKFVGLNAYRSLTLKPPLHEAWIKRYTKMFNHLIDANVPKSVLLCALKQQFAPSVDKNLVEEFADYVYDSKHFLLPVLLDDEDNKSLVLYSVPQTAFRNVSVLSMPEALFFNVPWWEPNEIRMLTLKNSEPALIWTSSETDDFTFVGDHKHFRHAATRENLLVFELIYAR